MIHVQETGYSWSIFVTSCLLFCTADPLLKVDPYSKGKQENSDRVTYMYPECVSVPLKRDNEPFQAEL